jgi:cell division protein FtsZ
MSNAGSALMGIGRASGENRAVEAAKQATESPLLEVSIDGARGVLFNVIGGKDMSMHEINAAAETITAAADPSANIIFGATINDDVEGEVIVTVVATGFDASYYARPSNATDGSTSSPQSNSVVSQNTSNNDDVDMQDVDMDLDKEAPAATLGSLDSNEEEVPSIWSMDTDENQSKEEADDDKKEAEDSKKNNSGEELEDQDELEKPSFLRRFKRNKSEKSQEKTEEK